MTERPHRRVSCAWILAAWILAQALLTGWLWWRTQGSFYPNGYDQLSYLLRAAVLASPDGEFDATSPVFAQGWLLEQLAHLLTSVDRRLPPVLWIWLLQAITSVALWATVRAKLGTHTAWATLGLWIGARTHALYVGGPVDFRYDYPSMLLWTLVLLCLWRGRLGGHLGWTLAAGAVGGVLAITRTIAGVYLTAAAPALVLVAWWLARRDAGSADRPRPLRVLAAIGLGAALALPIVINNWPAITEYYGNHLTPREGLARGVERPTFGSNLVYYLKSLRKHHLGMVGSGLGGVVLIGSLAARGGRRRARPVGDRGIARALVAVMLPIPLLILALGHQRSHLVAQIALGPTVVLLATLPTEPGDSRWARRALGTLAIAGFLSFATVAVRDAESVHAERQARGHTEARAGMERLEQELVTDRIVAVSVFDVHDWLSAYALRWLRFQRTGSARPEVWGLLGHTIYARSRAEIDETLARSHVVLCPQFEQPSGNLPAQQQLFEYGREFCRQPPKGWEEHPQFAFSCDGAVVRVFARPNIIRR